MSIKTCYVASACNQTPNIAHWGKNNLICYGSCNAVYIYDIKFGSGGKVVSTLCGHKNKVNAVRWIGGTNNETELVSGSSESTIVWSYKNNVYVPCILQVQANVVDGFYKDSKAKHAIVITASVDCTISIWNRTTDADDFQHIQRVDLGYNICMSVKMNFLPDTEALILACAMDNSQIQLYVESEPLHFTKSQALKGHENWVRGLDFTINDNGNLLLASASQDAFIRLWEISPIKSSENTNTFQDDLFKKGSIKLSNEREFAISLESILAGHEGWVYSVNWSPHGLRLLSASLDKTMIIWEWDADVGLWLEKVRVGEVGGNTLGFYGGMFGPDGKSMMAHGYHGAFHIWAQSEETNKWGPMVTVGGHFNEVVDMAWESRGEYLLTVSTDQTSRIHAPWSRNGENMTWHEIARPQVHGYDLSCVAMLSRYTFASGAEEKVIRTFKAPRNFISNFKRICQMEEDPEELQDEGPQGASVPSLGLSNKAVYEADNTEIATAISKKDPYPEESHFTATDMTEPPTEETLLQNTLWPEIQKLYGHGYEVYAMTSTREGDILASVCKATKIEHAAILLWDTSAWSQFQKLLSHTLTVVQLAFSPDSKQLLSVSRDRRWSLFTRPDLNTKEFTLVATTDKTNGIHSRIIWSCAWSQDSKYFSTGSRDGKVVVWTKNEHKQAVDNLGQYESASERLEFKNESVTALAFSPYLELKEYLLAIGFESGNILLYNWQPGKWEPLIKLTNGEAHHLTVRRILFRPVLGRAGSKLKTEKGTIQIASCSSDCSVKIYDFNLACR